MTTNLTAILEARNRATFDAVYNSTTQKTTDPTIIIGAAGKDLTGPLNIDGGKPQSFYAGMANIDAGYYNETYGGITYGLDGGTP